MSLKVLVLKKLILVGSILTLVYFGSVLVGVLSGVSWLNGLMELGRFWEELLGR